MDIKIIRKEEYQTSEWSGGKTTEIYLYPGDGDYGRREFQVRVSSATVELPESQFTKLPGVERFITTLEGEMELTHRGIRSRKLKPYEVERFMGDWDTVSVGKVRDFNLMVKDGAKGTMECVQVEAESRCTIKPEGGKWQQVLVYAAEGDGYVCGQKTESGETALLTSYNQEEIILENSGSDPFRLAVCAVQIEE